MLQQQKHIKKAKSPAAALPPELISSLSHTLGQPLLTDAKMRTRNIDVFYGEKQALHGISLDLGRQQTLALIGPSGCGKSTYLRCLNRMNDAVQGCKVAGEITLDKEDISDPKADVVPIRARVGMVFQKPNPFVRSIYDNVAYGPKIHGLASNKNDMDEIVETCLKRVGLWDEVKDRLDQKGTSLSGGQQQRLCLARTIAVRPEVILLDEPCSALDPIATGVVEELIMDLSQEYSLAIVTHSLSQAQRVAQRIAYFHLGYLVEVNNTEQAFEYAESELTRAYLGGKFG